jgi:hypothetical protein
LKSVRILARADFLCPRHMQHQSNQSSSDIGFIVLGVGE